MQIIFSRLFWASAWFPNHVVHRENNYQKLLEIEKEISQVVFILRAQPQAHYLFLLPIVFGINLIHFFDEEKDGAAGNSIVCFGASMPCHTI